MNLRTKTLNGLVCMPIAWFGTTVYSHNTAVLMAIVANDSSSANALNDNVHHHRHRYSTSRSIGLPMRRLTIRYVSDA